MHEYEMAEVLGSGAGVGGNNFRNVDAVFWFRIHFTIHSTGSTLADAKCGARQPPGDAYLHSEERTSYRVWCIHNFVHAWIARGAEWVAVDMGDGDDAGSGVLRGAG